MIPRKKLVAMALWDYYHLRIEVLNIHDLLCMMDVFTKYAWAKKLEQFSLIILK